MTFWAVWGHWKSHLQTPLRNTTNHRQVTFSCRLEHSPAQAEGPEKGTGEQAYSSYSGSAAGPPAPQRDTSYALFESRFEFCLNLIETFSNRLNL